MQISILTSIEWRPKADLAAEGPNLAEGPKMAEGLTLVVIPNIFFCVFWHFFITLTLIFNVSRHIQMKSISEIESTHRDLSNDAIEISNGRREHFF